MIINQYKLGCLHLDNPWLVLAELRLLFHSRVPIRLKRVPFFSPCHSLSCGFVAPLKFYTFTINIVYGDHKLQNSKWRPCRGDPANQEHPFMAHNYYSIKHYLRI
jgi:hypothetical protein